MPAFNLNVSSKLRNSSGIANVPATRQSKCFGRFKHDDTTRFDVEADQNELIMKTIAMFGPSISEPTKIVNRDVPECDLQAYKAAGYAVGSVAIPDDEKRADGTPCETYTEADVAEQMPKAKSKGK